MRRPGLWLLPLAVLLLALDSQFASAARPHVRSGRSTLSTSGAANTLSRRLMETCGSGCSNVLLTAGNFGVLGSTTVTNTGPTFVYGSLGVAPGANFTGMNDVTYEGNLNSNDSVSTKAQSDAHIGYAQLQAMTPTANLTGSDLGGLILGPGVYHFKVAAPLNGNLTLDAYHDSSAIFVIQTGTTLVTNANAVVTLVNGAQPCNVYFAIGSSATFGANSLIMGSVVAYTAITVGHGTSVNGSLIALGAAVTMDTNILTPTGGVSDAVWDGGVGRCAVPYSAVAPGVLCCAAVSGVVRLLCSCVEGGSDEATTARHGTRMNGSLNALGAAVAMHGVGARLGMVSWGVFCS
uniref:Ice-binding protein 11 n=1 Tax=Chloromonas brevispina TaxID=201318 RepID=A0A060L1F4_9CHLO|nr:ice-binding protein 11 [Chloromonas brevispina]